MLIDKAVRFEKYSIISTEGTEVSLPAKTFIIVDRVFPKGIEPSYSGVAQFLAFQVTSKIHQNKKYNKLIIVETILNEKLGIKTDDLYECTINLDKINNKAGLEKIDMISITDELMEEINNAVENFDVSDLGDKVITHTEDTLKIIKPKRRMEYDICDNIKTNLNNSY